MIEFPVERVDAAKSAITTKRARASELKDNAAKAILSITDPLHGIPTEWRKLRRQEDAEALRLKAALLEVEADAEEALLKKLFEGFGLSL